VRSTGAVESRKGAFELADGGTIVLDEITEAPLSVQASLLRAVERRVIRRVGEMKEIPVDVKVIAISNQDLEKAILEGRLREDLYYRLSCCHIHIPPLRERTEDIPVLAEYFIDEANKRYGLNIEGIDKEVIQAMKRYEWRGNVRELKNFILRLTLKKREGRIRIDDLKGELLGIRTRGQLSREDVERALIICNWNKSRAARMLGIHRQQLQRLVKRYGIEKR